MFKLASLAMISMLAAFSLGSRDASSATFAPLANEELCTEAHELCIEDCLLGPIYAKGACIKKCLKRLETCLDE